jgi:hypothetical protein
LALTIKRRVEGGEMPVFNLVAESNEKLQIFAFWRVVSAKVLPQALLKIPMLRLTIDFRVANASTGAAGLSVPRATTLLIRYRMKKGGPGKHYQNYKMCGAKARSRPVINVHCRNCRGLAFLKIVANISAKSLWH